MASQSNQISELQVQWDTPSQKSKVESDPGRYPMLTSDLHAQVFTHLSSQVHTHTNTSTTLYIQHAYMCIICSVYAYHTHIVLYMYITICITHGICYIVYMCTILYISCIIVYSICIYMLYMDITCALLYMPCVILCVLYIYYTCVYMYVCINYNVVLNSSHKNLA